MKSGHKLAVQRQENRWEESAVKKERPFVIYACMHAGGPSPIPEADKAAVRDNLLEGIVRAPQVVRTQLGECLKSIVHVDFPERWPGLLPIVLQNLSSQVCALSCTTTLYGVVAELC